MMNEDNPRFYGECPFCHMYVSLHSRKDFESFTMNEVTQHMKKVHPADTNAYLSKTRGIGLPYIELKEFNEISEDRIYKELKCSQDLY